MWAGSLAGARVAHSASGLDALGDLVGLVHRTRTTYVLSAEPNWLSGVVWVVVMPSQLIAWATLMGSLGRSSTSRQILQAGIASYAIPGTWIRVSLLRWSGTCRLGHVGAVAKCAWKCGAAGPPCLYRLSRLRSVSGLSPYMPSSCQARAEIVCPQRSLQW